MNELRLLAAIKQDQQSFAIDSLRTGGDKSQFDFGHRVGYFAGLERACQLLLKLVEEENKLDL